MLAKRLKSRIARFSSHAPLQAVLIFPFLLQIFMAVGLTGYFSLRHGQQAVNDLASQLSSEISARIQQHVRGYVAQPHLVHQVHGVAAKYGNLDLDNFSDLERYFWEQLQQFDSFSSIYFGNTQGEFIGVQRRDQRSFVLWLMQQTDAPERKTYRLDNQGKRAELLDTQTFDTHSRPWYQTAVYSGKPTWSPIYKFASHDYAHLGITPAVPIYSESRELEGVLAIDLTLSQINDFLRQLEISPSGQAFIIERSGEIVATSVAEKSQNPADAASQRLHASQSQDPLVKRAMQYLVKECGSLNQIDTPQQFRSALAGQQHLLEVTPLSDGRGLDWLIVVIIPKADFMGQIHHNTRTTLLLCLGALGLAATFGVFTSRWIAHPIRRLSRASEVIAQSARSRHTGDLDQTVEIKGIQELEVLARSFNQMASQLQSSFTTLEKTNEALEIRVEQRTAALQQAKAAADTANHAKSQFLAAMSHELRTPLNAILGFTQLLLKDGSIKPEHQANLGIVNRSGEHLLSLINDVLEMSKIQAGQVTLNESNFDLYCLLDSLEERFQPTANAKGLQLIFNCAPNVPHCIRTDERKLHQVLVNLLGNGIKFTSEGQVTLRIWPINRERATGNRKNRSQESGVKSQESRRSAIKPQNFPLGDAARFWDAEDSTKLKIQPSQNPKSKIQNLNTRPLPPLTLFFEVSDTGPGIAASELEIIFDAFEQTKVSPKREGGTGLGLAISRQFVRLMGGDITVNSRLWKGTDFQFSIQVHSTQEGASLNSALFPQDLGVAAGQLRKSIALDELQTPSPYAFRGPRPSTISSPRNKVLHPSSLGGMSEEWIAALHQAAIQVDADLINHLIQQIPEADFALAQALTDLVRRFEYDRIMELTESAAQHRFPRQQN